MCLANLTLFFIFPLLIFIICRIFAKVNITDEEENTDIMAFNVG